MVRTTLFFLARDVAFFFSSEVARDVSQSLILWTQSCQTRWEDRLKGYEVDSEEREFLDWEDRTNIFLGQIREQFQGRCIMRKLIRSFFFFFFFIRAVSIWKLVKGLMIRKIWGRLFVFPIYFLCMLHDDSLRCRTLLHCLWWKCKQISETAFILV